MSSPARANMKSNLVWIDMEMTGLDPDKDVIIEIAAVVTDPDLNVIATGPDLVVQRDQRLFAGMDKWNQEHHTKSGLWAAVIASKVTEREAEQATLDFIKQHVTVKSSPLCGNSVWQDRRFLYRYMPALEEYLHYRLIDVSTIKELTGRWYGDQLKYDAKKNSHRALDDIMESIDELKYYRSKVFVPK